jgi:hypothetical protein
MKWILTESIENIYKYNYKKIQNIHAEQYL